MSVDRSRLGRGTGCKGWRRGEGAPGRRGRAEAAGGGGEGGERGARHPLPSPRRPSPPGERGPLGAESWGEKWAEGGRRPSPVPPLQPDSPQAGSGPAGWGAQGRGWAGCGRGGASGLGGGLSNSTQKEAGRAGAGGAPGGVRGCGRAGPGTREGRGLAAPSEPSPPLPPPPRVLCDGGVGVRFVCFCQMWIQMEHSEGGEQSQQQQPWGKLIRLGADEAEPHVLLLKREWTIGRKKGGTGTRCAGVGRCSGHSSDPPSWPLKHRKVDRI